MAPPGDLRLELAVVRVARPCHLRPAGAEAGCEVAGEHSVRPRLALAYGVWRFDGSRRALKQVLNSYLPALEPLADKFGVDLQESGPVRLIQQALAVTHSTLLLVTLGVLAYGILELVEAFGLWFKKRWGEYVAVVATALLIPLEIHEILVRVTWLRVGALVVNLFAVAYILWTKRLFGAQGGRAAFDAERRDESLLELENATTP